MKPEKTKGPLEIVTVKGASVAIYWTPTTKAGKVYPLHSLVYTEAGKRRRRYIADIDKARSTAKEIARQLSDGTGHVQALSPSEVADYTAAMKIIRAVPGVTLASICQQHVEASAALGDIGTLTEAAHHLRKSRSEGNKTAPVANLVRDFIAEKEREEMSDAYLRDVKRRLTLFASTFRTNISGVKTEDISVWLKSIKARGRNSNNYRNAVCTLFSFARERGFLPRDKKTEAELLSRAKEAITEIGIYTPEQITTLLLFAPKALAPSIAIGVFAGLRSTEIFRLDWEQVRIEQGNIEVTAKNAKTAQRRLVPILDNLKSWLADSAKPQGRVAPNYQNITNFSRAISKACNDAGIEMVDNGFRHSFASYRLAVVKSADQVALEMGNSPRKLFSNYREIVTEGEAQKWFAVTPDASTEKAKRG